MIVNYNEQGWEIISQRSHGLLAAQICANWKVSSRPARWVDTLIATADHDDVFNELETGPLLSPSNGPMNFKMNIFDLELSQRLIDRAEMKGSFIALLIFRHIAFTHCQEPKAKRFISKLRKKERAWHLASNSNPAQLDAAYKLLEFCDAFSLLICQKLVPPEGRKIEIGSGPEQVTYELRQQQDRLIVHPWPFDKNTFKVDYEKRDLHSLTFKDDDDFRDHLKNSVTEQVVCTLSKK